MIIIIYYILGYIQDYVNTYVSIPETESSVNDQMAAYEERELNRMKELESKRGVADEDGFVTVISSKARTAALDADVQETPSQGGYFFDPYARLRSALTASNPLTHRNKKSSTPSTSSATSTGLDNFYRFQVRQKRSHEVDELKRKFEEDKRRISELKKNKIFSN